VLVNRIINSYDIHLAESREETVVALNEVTDLSVEDGIATVTIDSPPVNALSVAVRDGLSAAFARAFADQAVAAIVLICAGRTFFAGADISEFDGAIRGASLHDIIAALENGSKPVVAAIHGTALGGGLELALGCHYRLAIGSAKLGLPEVALGLLPGAGGTQRLPRLVGAAQALEMIGLGKPVGAAEALRLGIIDAVAGDHDLRGEAIGFAKALLREDPPLRRVRDLDDKLATARENPALFDEFRQKHARAFRGFKAPENIVKAVEAAVRLPFDEGLAREQMLFEELLKSRESAAQRYAFFAERGTSKIPGLPADTAVLPVKTAAIIGAGTMGGGIAMNFLNIGMQVTLVEQTQAALDRGLAVIRNNYDIAARKGRLSAQDVAQRMALITPSVTLEAVAEADLIIEAVFENLEIKASLFAQLDKIAKPGAILASNTSFLDLDRIAQATARPEQVVGLHFFSPANVMRLLEVVRGARTSDTVIATAMQLGRKIGKVCVLSRVCNGFIANRVMARRAVEADRIVLEGMSPWEVDRVMLDYGFPMGPFAMMDLVGLDVLSRDERSTTSSPVVKELCAIGRLGQKAGAGFYDYAAGRAGMPSKIAEDVIRAVADRQGIERKEFSDEEVVRRLLLPVVQEAREVLKEGVAIRASDIDVAVMLGYGWPVYTGGPMFWADQSGL